MALKGMQRTWTKLLGPLVAKNVKADEFTRRLQRAHVPMRPEAYLANALANSGLTFFFALVFVAVTNLLLVPRLAPQIPVLARVQGILWLIPLFLGFMVYFLAVSDLGSKARKRAKDINLKLPYALNYVAAMASAGVIPQEIFRSLGRQKIYGQVAAEAAWIYKDIGLHGIDIVTALKRSMDRTPSVKFQEFLQGAITTITSGGDLKNYFLEKAARYQWENRQDQKAFIDTMGLMAETYVTVAVAGPLFMIVMLAIIAIITGAGPTNLSMLVYILLPVINFGYAFLLKAMIPEV